MSPPMCAMYATPSLCAPATLPTLTEELGDEPDASEDQSRYQCDPYDPANQQQRFDLVARIRDDEGRHYGGDGATWPSDGTVDVGSPALSAAAAASPPIK